MARPRRRFLKLTIGAELRRQLVTSVRVRRGPYGDIPDFGPVVRKAHSVRPIGVGIGDKGYDSEESHEILGDELHAMSMIPPRTEGVPLWRTEGLYRKEMQRRFSERAYHQRSKDETIFSVVKRTMGDEMRSVRTKGLNNEIRVRMIAYNAMRVASSLVRGFLQSRLRARDLQSALESLMGDASPTDDF
ncbi:MAG: transposase [Nitrososphaerota archaeon]|nr:transposase [Nitrososphaerota archaeon]MDG6987358.1 transposase [Nitrososphaerota archaeon]